MNAFDAPMPSIDGQYAFGRGLLRCPARDPQCDIPAVRAGLFVAGFALNHKNLAAMRAAEVAIERRAAPVTPRLPTAMIGRRDLDEIESAARLRRQGDIAFQRRLLALAPLARYPHISRDVRANRSSNDDGGDYGDPVRLLGIN